MGRPLKKYTFDPDFAIPPGETLKETMISLEMSQAELADRIGLTVQTLNRIFKGSQPITYSTANKLELVTGVPADFWNNLEVQYRQLLARIEEKDRLQSDLEWLKIIPVKELAERGVISAANDKTEQLRQVLSFYSVSDAECWKKVWLQPQVAARRSKCFETCPGPASAWLRLGELEAHKTECAKFDAKLFKSNLEHIRQLTMLQPKLFIPEMKRLCAAAGVAFVLVREMKKVPWNGATKWLSPNKVMLLLSLRGKGEDHFWFTFFHEACHIINDSPKDVFINDATTDDPKEARADEFAAEFLIPSKYNAYIRSIKMEKEILQLADTLKISAAIVAGRYRYLTNKWTHFGNLIRKFQWG